jgi:Protein of unknown function (DUF1822)
MTFTPDLFDPTQPDLTVSATIATQAWQSRSGGTPASGWNAYLNQLCLSAVLPWLQESLPQAKVWLNPATLFSFWELVNGTAIVINHKRLVLIPTEALDSSELRVPQEWVDIPGWAADYYIGVKVNPDELQIQPWGYCTHRQLKAGAYDAGDRTYALGEEELVSDLSLLWVVQQINPQEATKAELPALPALPLAQAKNLLERLGNPAVLQPRLAIPFAIWGALIEHGGWRQQLAEQRRSLPSRSIWQWLESGVDRLGQSLGWEQIGFQPSLASARGEVATQPPTMLVRSLSIANQRYGLWILPFDRQGIRVWRFELRNLAIGGLIPAGFKLRLLTEDLLPFEGNEDSADTEVDHLYVEVTLEPREGIVWEVEPLPEAYDREILRF